MILRTSALAVMGLLTLTTAGYAQGAVPSPPSNSFNWLNLNRNGNSAAANYYGIVRPNNMFQSGLQNVQQEYNNLTQSATNNNDPNNTTLRETGHAATFLNYSHYYPKMPGGAGAGQRTGGGGAPPGRR